MYLGQPGREIVEVHIDRCIYIKHLNMLLVDMAYAHPPTTP